MKDVIYNTNYCDDAKCFSFFVVEKSDKKNEELFKSEKINSQNKNCHSNQKSYFITK